MLKSKVADSISQHLHLLEEGRVLALDPSSGSTGSMPGFALSWQGTLEDSGHLQLPAGKPIEQRLACLLDLIEKEFLLNKDRQPQVCVIEQVAPLFRGKGRRRPVVNIPLQQAIGVMEAAILRAGIPLIRMPVNSWQTRAGATYHKIGKTDETDALYILIAALKIAKEISSISAGPTKKRKGQKKNE